MGSVGTWTVPPPRRPLCAARMSSRARSGFSCFLTPHAFASALSAMMSWCCCTASGRWRG
eukprot:1846482-Prymnesium_polylepis.1